MRHFAGRLIEKSSDRAGATAAAQPETGFSATATTLATRIDPAEHQGLFRRGHRTSRLPANVRSLQHAALLDANQCKSEDTFVEDFPPSEAPAAFRRHAGNEDGMVKSMIYPAGCLTSTAEPAPQALM
nr:hypothetical protein [Methylobacterium sp. ZNC0032]